MIEHKILINENFLDCFGEAGSPIIKGVLNLYEIDLNKGFLFEYTRDLDKTDEIIIECKVCINKGSSILIWSFTLTLDNMLKLTLKDGAYSMIIMPKSDISRIVISEDKRAYKAFHGNINITIEFKSNDNLDFYLQHNEHSEQIIKFIVGLNLG